MQPLFQCKSKKYYLFCDCVCSLRNPVCNVHAPYCHVWSIRLYVQYFSTYPINGTFFGKSYWIQNDCFDFLYVFVCLFDTFPILRRTETDMIIDVYWQSTAVLFVSDFNTLRTGDADLRFYVTTVQDGWRRFAFLTRWNSVHLQVLLSATPQMGNVSRGITPSNTTRVFGEYFLKISVHKNS